MGKKKLNKETLEIKKLELEIENFKWYRIPGYYTAGVTLLAVLFSVGVSLYSGYFDKVRLTFQREELQHDIDNFEVRKAKLYDSISYLIKENNKFRNKYDKLFNAHSNLKTIIRSDSLKILFYDKMRTYLGNIDIETFESHGIDSMQVYKNIILNDKKTIRLLQQMMGEGGLGMYEGLENGIYNTELSQAVEKFRGNRYKMTKDYDPVYKAIERQYVDKLIRGKLVDFPK